MLSQTGPCQYHSPFVMGHNFLYVVFWTFHVFVWFSVFKSGQRLFHTGFFRPFLLCGVFLT